MRVTVAVDGRATRTRRHVPQRPRLVFMIGMLLMVGTSSDAAAQLARSADVPHYITGLSQIEPDAAAALCAALPTDTEARREAASINQLARDVFGDDAAGVAVPLKNSDGFVAPPVRSGKRSQTATVEVEYTGFSPEAKSAFQYAVDIWSALIESPVPIRIEASWTSLSPGVLGSAGPDILLAEFGFGEPDTWYPSSLADALAGEDLSPESADVVANFNRDFGAWYFGLDGNAPPGEIDFVTVVMHEIGHGLGFFGTMDIDDGANSEECDGVEGNGCWGFEQYPGLADIFERFAEDQSGNLLIDTNIYPNPSAPLANALMSDDVYFDGAATLDAYGARPQLYTPSTWNGGSSFSHLDESSFPAGDPSSLMTPFVSASEAIHDLGTVGCGIFADMGWTTTLDCGSGFVPEAPSIPVPMAPADGAAGVPVEVTLSWEESLQADAYSIEVAESESFASPTLSVSGITESSYVVDGLQNDTEYFWHVRATNTQSASGYSTTYRFATVSAPPAAPALVAPEDGVGGVPTTLALSWQADDEADEYMLEIDTTAEFGDPVLRISTTEGEVELTGLVNDQTYFWRVQGLSGEEAGDWSNTWAFTTMVGLPAPPKLASPEDDDSSVATDSELAWHSAAHAESYEIVIASDSMFASIEADSALADTIYIAVGLENNEQYFWRVRGWNAAGAGAWSAVFEFRTIIAAPAVPQLTSPENAGRDLPTIIMFRWREAVDAASYEFELSKTLNFDDPVLNITDIDTIVVKVEDLEHDAQYFWRVRAINSGGRSVFTSPFTFFTAVAPPADLPQPISPLSGAAGLDTVVKLTWNAIPGTEQYRVQIGADSTLSEGLIEDSSLAGTSLAVAGLDHETSYFWRISAINAGGQGPWSSAVTFTTRIARPSIGPMLGTPQDGATSLDRSLLFEWNAVATAEAYELVISRDSKFAEFVFEESELESTSREVADLEYGMTYFWRVRARNAGGEGPWSDVRRFTTKQEPSGVSTNESGLPKRFSLYPNYPNPFNPVTTFGFALPYAEHVRLDVMDVAGRTVAVLVDRRLPAGGHDVRWTATGLPSGTYMYRLRAGDFVQARTFVLLK